MVQGVTSGHQSPSDRQVCFSKLQLTNSTIVIIFIIICIAIIIIKIFISGITIVIYNLSVLWLMVIHQYPFTKYIGFLCRCPIYFISNPVLGVWEQGCISCGILVSGIRARGVSWEHMENMEMFSCSPT